jgi:DNA-binding YbaB/EbfC family protein
MKGNPMQMLRQVQQMQTKMQAVQKELEESRVEASAGGGVVKAVVTGGQKVVSVTIAPEVLADDPEMVADLVVAALNEALDRSREMAAERMQAVTAGLGLPPGLLG